MTTSEPSRAWLILPFVLCQLALVVCIPGGMLITKMEHFVAAVVLLSIGKKNTFCQIRHKGVTCTHYFRFRRDSVADNSCDDSFIH